MPFLLILVAALFFPVVTSAEDTLCNNGETALFSCHVGPKIMSLCRQQPNPPELTYRYGTLQKLELAYPTKLRSSRNAFYREALPLYGGGMTYIGFFNGEYEYRIYSKISRSDSPTAEARVPVFEDGINIYRAGRLVKQLVCDDGGEGFRDSIDWLPLKR